MMKIKVQLCRHLILLITSVSLCSCATDYVEGTVYMNHEDASFVAGSMDKTGAAYGYFNNTMMETGWGTLEIKAGYVDNATGLLNNIDYMYAAGFLEGMFTAKQMWLHYQNMKATFFADQKPEVVDKVKDFFNKQDAWTRQMISKHGNLDPFWRHVSYVLAQFDGISDAYMAVAEKQPDWESDKFVVQVLNGVGDLLDLMKALNPEGQPDISKMNDHEFMQYFNFRGHCSALIKVTGAYENLFLSHSSWFTYSATNRIYKIYDFNVNDPATGARRMAFSSYPGFLESLDDFYLLGSKMVMLQTTNNVYNASLYKLVQPQSLLAWHRVRVANMMARTGKQWGETLAMYNSGTYNNQYMVIDLKQVELNEDLHSGTLWVVEQIPGLVVSQDQTTILRAGYWPSYNVPFYDEIYKLSGYPEIVKKYGLDFSYQLAPRAKIFRRDQAKVTDLQGMKNMMRYNDYKNDPYSNNNPCNTICCRGDLDSVNPKPYGCYDTKVSDFKMAVDMQSHSISGPTLGNGLEPFSWSSPFTNQPHIGLPHSYNFDWQNMQGQL